MYAKLNKSVFCKNGLNKKRFMQLFDFLSYMVSFLDKKKTSIGFYDQHCVSMTYYDHEICTDLYQNLLRTEKGTVLA